MRLVFDSESDGLKIEATRLWCIAAIDANTDERYTFAPDRIQEGLDLLRNADELIGHNILNHDLPLFYKLYPGWKESGKVTDTFILSSLVKPDRLGGHSIENFGIIFGRHKPAHEDWSKYTPEMMHRCLEDTEINLMAYEKILKEMKDWDWSNAIRLESAIARINAQQELNGVNFDEQQARRTLERILKRLRKVEKEIRVGLPKKLSSPYQVPVNRPFLKSGDYHKSVREWFPEQADTVGGPFTRITYEDINLNSPEQVKSYLLSQGWQPTQWNYKKEGKRVLKDVHGNPIKSSPKLTEDSYASIKGGVPALIAEYNVLKHRRTLIYNVRERDGKLTGWLNAIRPDGRITAGGIPQGTPTGRYRHTGVVNVPKADPEVVLGREMRELFIPRPGYLLIGSDAKALENRVEGHYTAYYDGGEYAESLLNGDPHTKNALAFTNACQTEITRQKAKNIKYAITYGAQPPKVAETAGVSERHGKILYDAFWRANPALEALKHDVDAKCKKKGFLVGIDGRKLFIRSAHARLNTLFQCTGSLLVKTATIFLWGLWVPRYGLDAKLVLHQHDEWQSETHPKDSEKYIELCLKSFVQSGKHFNMNIPIEGDIKVGQNWAETH